MSNKTDKELKKAKLNQSIFSFIISIIGAVLWIYLLQFLGYKGKGCLYDEEGNCIKIVHHGVVSNPTLLSINKLNELMFVLAAVVILPIAIVGIVWICVKIISGLWKSKR